ncbi:hypothetical protein BDV27DRAFT_172386 [Aspergillus caelatus]|uniref:Fe2OG dioxygenase domain-containing protein n=1 Tax=Aspergillus caelatus TaxID=61420 RepID=A0A5N7AKJ4_9EURO|nr:uncharacterized protein BDV27DRAFT_172386 [Aspergillus caelatus]KAE8369726.1 hypothetical protein BDV27DRAFT_172386 [Aspergillus caelatus]
MNDDEGGHVFDERIWRRESCYDVPIEEYAHTVIELEDEVNRVMTEGCKVDACLDWFICCLKEINPDHSQRMYSPDNFESFAGSRFEEIKKELRENLNRLTPDYLDDETDILEVEKLRKRLESRWHKVQVGSNIPKRENVSSALLDTLMEKHCHQRSKHTEASSTPALPEVQDRFLDSCLQLKTFIEGERTTASYACGGSIPIVQTTGPPDTHPRGSGPINIFWSIGNGSARHLSLPLRADAEDANPEMLQHLIGSCGPASFGRGEETVIDLSYRKAGKLEPENFATSFHPADFGIIETIEKVLLPGIVGEAANRLGSRKIYAELYKLNIYSGPSGLFRSHVDTPRSQSQIGSLVVCLPWAAFYSDCEHEIKTITEGDRITLTYNLYVSNRADSALLSIMEPKSLPLYGWVKDLLMKPGFLDGEGLKGQTWYCIPFSKLGLKGHIEGRSGYLGEWGYYDFVNDLQPYLARNKRLLVNFSEVLPQVTSREDIADIDRRWKLLKMTRHVRGMKEAISFARRKGLPYKEDSSFVEDGAQIGSCLRPYETTEWGNDMQMDDVLPYVWPAYYLPGITWLTEPKHEEMAFSQVTYGNEAGLGTRYSCAAIFAVIPPWGRRDILRENDGSEVNNEG